jgi:hypothetical protein
MKNSAWCCAKQKMVRIRCRATLSHQCTDNRDLRALSRSSIAVTLWEGRARGRKSTVCRTAMWNIERRHIVHTVTNNLPRTCRALAQYLALCLPPPPVNRSTCGLRAADQWPSVAVRTVQDGRVSGSGERTRSGRRRAKVKRTRGVCGRVDRTSLYMYLLLLGRARDI